MAVRVKVEPLSDRVIVEPLEAKDKTPGGILLPDVAKEKPRRGRVLAVGPGRLTDEGVRVAVDVAVGDEVLYSHYAGCDVEIDGKELKVLSESDVLAKVSK